MPLCNAQGTQQNTVRYQLRERVITLCAPMLMPTAVLFHVFLSLDDVLHDAQPQLLANIILFWVLCHFLGQLQVHL